MRKLTNREKRLLVLFGIFLAVLAYDWRYRRWSPAIVLESEHYIIYSTANEYQTQLALNKAELLYNTYNTFMTPLLKINEKPRKLKLKLYASRDEFRRCNRIVGWAEARYRRPYCYQYINEDERRPYHWMIHEATHQLNNEVAHLKLTKWLDEGLASYFGTSVLGEHEIELGKTDIDTYPIWWLPTWNLSGDLKNDIKSNAVIPLGLILRDKTGPSMRRHFNTYYMHWWSLTHFCLHYDNGRYRDAFFDVIRDGGTHQSFEKNIGPIRDIQAQWYQYIQDTIKALP
ncbi:MAG: hypothetical protein ACYS8Z_09015 [Planctomycetota bacterium]